MRPSGDDKALATIDAHTKERTDCHQRSAAQRPVREQCVYTMQWPHKSDRRPVFYGDAWWQAHFKTISASSESVDWHQPLMDNAIMT